MPSKTRENNALKQGIILEFATKLTLKANIKTQKAVIKFIAWSFMLLFISY